MVLLLLPISGYIREECLKGSDRLLRLLQLRLDVIPLCLSFLFIHLLRLQPSLDLPDDDLLAADLGLDRHSILLDGGVAEQQDVPAALAGIAVLVELIGLCIRAEDDVSGSHEVDLAGVESSSSPDGWGICGGDGETDGSRERPSDPGGGIGGGDWLVKLNV